MNHNKVAVCHGTKIELIEIFNDRKRRIVLKGHVKPIKTIARFSREIKILAKAK
jgi:hypothetical protein